MYTEQNEFPRESDGFFISLNENVAEVYAMNAVMMIACSIILRLQNL